MSRYFLAFDIDDTLVSGGYGTFRDSIYFAINSVYNTNLVKRERSHLSGMTDKGILLSLLEETGIPRKKALSKIKLVYKKMNEYVLEKIDSKYSNTVFSSASNFIKKIHNKNGFILGVITGNEKDRAQIKLRLIGLEKYFSFGVYGHSSENRNILAKKLKNILTRNFDFNEDDFLIIFGDTPRDILSAKEVGAYSIALATGKYSCTELSKHNPSIVLENLDQIDKILDFILSIKMNSSH